MSLRVRPPFQNQLSWGVGARHVLELALDEARELNPKLGLPNLVDTGHLLLALIREPESTGARVLRALDVDLGNLRRQTLMRLALAAKKAQVSIEARGPHDLFDLNTRFGYDPRTGRTTTFEQIRARGGTLGRRAGILPITSTRSYSMWWRGMRRRGRRVRGMSSSGRWPCFRLSERIPRCTPSAREESAGFAYGRLFPEAHAYSMEGLAAKRLLAACGTAALPVMVSAQAGSVAAWERVLKESLLHGCC